MRKKILEKRLAKLNAKLAEIRNKVQSSTDAAEVRELTARAEEISDDIEDINAELAEINAEEARAAAQQNETRDAVPANATLVNPIQNTGASFSAPETRSGDPFASMEYRQAFMAFAQTGAPIPANFMQRAEAANTESLGATIPTTIINELINEIRKVYRKNPQAEHQGRRKDPCWQASGHF